MSAALTPLSLVILGKGHGGRAKKGQSRIAPQVCRESGHMQTQRQQGCTPLLFGGLASLRAMDHGEHHDITAILMHLVDDDVGVLDKLAGAGV
jgi:hypothetical protein